MSQLEQEFWQAELKTTDVGEGEPPGQLAQLWNSFQRQLGENPKLTIAVGLATGVLVGWLLKRRG